VIAEGHVRAERRVRTDLAAVLVPTLTAPTCILEHAAQGGQPEYVVRKAREVSEHMLVNIRRAFEAGVKIAGGSDAGTPFNYHDKYAEEVILMQRLLGMSAQQALHAATATAAELIGLHRGVLAPGPDEPGRCPFELGQRRGARERLGTEDRRVRLVERCLVPELDAEGIEVGDAVEIGVRSEPVVVEQGESNACEGSRSRALRERP